jgi:hypothetical protein
VTWVPRFCTSTVAPPTTPPEGSTTVPRNEPFEICAVALAARHMMHIKVRRRKEYFTWNS